MQNISKIKMYENDDFRDVLQDSIRPGGLLLTERAINEADFAPKSKILDVGCGCGTTINLLADKYKMQAMGLDISEKLVKIAQFRNPNLDVRIGSIYMLPYEESFFDGVFCECVMNLLDDREKALTEIWRVLTANGKLAVSDMYLINRKEKFKQLPFGTCINGILTQEDIIKQISQAGFRLIKWKDATDLYKGFLAQLIMNYGSIDVFWEQFTGASDPFCNLPRDSKQIKIGTYVSVWQKCDR